MVVHNFTSFIAVLLAILSACSADEPNDGYIFTSPRSLKIGANNQLQFQRFDSLDEGTLKVLLYYTESYNGNETLALEKEYNLEKGKPDTFLKFFVNTFDNDNVYSGRLQINGTIGDKKISGSDKVYFSTSKASVLLIQTDKPLYQPGQEVLFRVLKLNKDLKPSTKDDDVADVRVEDPKGTLLFQFLDVQLGNGIVQKSIPLSNDPVKGTWKITVSNKNNTDSRSTTFDVKLYTLPKFSVKITFPPFVLANADVFPVKICATYTYGQPVKAHLNLNASLEQYTWSSDKLPVLESSIELDGCYNYTLNASLIDPNNYRYRRIMVVANVIEDATGVQMNSTEYLQRQYSPLTLNFNTDQNQRQYFKPGLPYNGKLKVSNPDNTPASGEPVQLCYTVTRQRVIAGWSGTKKVQFCKNFTSDESGIIQYTISPQNVDSVSIQLDAKSTRFTDNKILNTPQTGMTLNPFYSPSGSFIQLAGIGHPLPCGTKKSIKLLYTSKESADYTFYYQVIKQGKVVGTGSQEVAFNTDDDVSSKFSNDNRLVNESEKRLVPPEDASENSSSSSSSSEEDCPSAREALYVPPIGEVKFNIDVDANLSPSFTLLVYYIRGDKETIADSQKFEVEKCFKNKVDFQFGDEVAQPGTKTAVQITASPNSLCGIKAVDKSISLLDSSDQLTLDKIFQQLEGMDTNIYYGSDPCNEHTPQPGLYKSASRIRPPGSYSTSSYRDSFASFQDAGYLVISNLILLTRPCKNNGGGYGGGGPIYQSDNYGGPGGGVALASVARRPAAPQAFSADSKSITKSAVDVRDYFPETWLFELQNVGPEGFSVFKKTLPHTITEWVGSAVCVSPQDGLGLSNTTTIKGFQAFFISYTLPTSAIRGEEITVVVSVFNYAEGALPLSISLDKNENFALVGESLDGDVCVQPGTSHNQKIKLKAMKLGKVNITVRAQTNQNSDVCGSSTVADSLAKDAITQPLNVEAEGFPAESVRSVLFCPTDEENQMYSKTFDLDLPEDVVPDSARAIFDVTGNVLGPAIENLDRLVALPTGCGEQNMVKFTPNYLVLDYLTDIGKLTDKVKSKALRNLNTGYQRELTYRHRDGSFSAFGEVDNSGSMFLTAFVLRSFYDAKGYITIDNKVLTQAQSWIVERQGPDGCFPNVGKIIDHGLQGGLEKEKSSGSITAYVLASLIVSNYENDTVIESALDCLNGDTQLTPYETYLYAYAEALAGKVDEAKKRIADIKPFANTTNGVEYYNNPNGTKALNLETVAYAVLANIKIGSSASDVLPLVRYMTENQNSRGGFYSTQDTCVGLDALSKFAKLVYKDPVDLLVDVEGGLTEKIEINEENKLLVQRNTVSTIPSSIKAEITGSGCGLIQASIRYNTKTAPAKKKFNLQVTGECSSSDCKKRKIYVTASYIPVDKKAGMSVVQIKMVTGTSPDRESLDKLTNDKTILRVDVEDNNVVVYLNEVSNDGTRFSFDVNEVIPVDNPQPGTVTVSDYYAPENSATTSYSFDNSDASQPSTESDGV